MGEHETSTQTPRKIIDDLEAYNSLMTFCTHHQTSKPEHAFHYIYIYMFHYSGCKDVSFTVLLFVFFPTVGGKQIGWKFDCDAVAIDFGEHVAGSTCKREVNN